MNEKLNINNIVTIGQNIQNVNIIVTDIEKNIKYMTHIPKSLANDNHTIRKGVVNVIQDTINKYNIDTIILEQNQLFIDRIDRYPDPSVMKNIILGFGIKVAIEDNFWDTIENIMEIPKYEWKNAILNKKVDYAIDLYKSHIIQENIYTPTELQDIDNNNYYETLCMSEISLCNKYMNKKYKINK